MNTGKLRTVIVALGAMATATIASADDVTLSDTPLFIASTADPNLMFILDDSGSMRWGFMPDELDGGNNFGSLDCTGRRYNYAGQTYRLCDVDEDARYLASPSTNDLYFDPDATYPPPLKPDGSSYPDADYTNAWVDGYAAARTDNPVTVDLGTRYAALMDPYFHGGGFMLADGTDPNGYLDEAFYYELQDGSGCDTLIPPDSCFSARKHPSTDEEKQAFANWYAYYRTRELSSRLGITEAFIDQPESMRIGYDTINSSWVERGVRPFSGEDRTEFFEWLQTHNAGGGTPLRNALDTIGGYYESESDEGPWADEPGVEDGQSADTFIECRQSAAILMTDGYYSGGNPGVGNVDGSNGDGISGPDSETYTYESGSPYADEHSNTLADVAMEYWVRDLQPSVANRVPTTEDNPAFWQHMSTYGIGLGVTGSITESDVSEAISNDEDLEWPDPADSDSAKIDDLLHAGINSRGGSFSATEPKRFANDLSKLLSDYIDMTGSSSGVTFDTATLEEDSLIFGARFDSLNWSGDLDARPLETDDNLDNPQVGEPVWSAADKLDAMDWQEREIMTAVGGTGVAFEWDQSVLSDEQVGDLRFGSGTSAERDTRAQNRLDYLKGDRSMEGSGTGDFRERDSRLGDIVNSTPVRVSEPASGWPDNDEFGEDGNRYSDFRSDKKDRTPVIYAGANDGMLHGFRATENGGDEMFAFMPSAIFSDEPGNGLHHLTSQDYRHDYYVDLAPLVSDAFIKGKDSNGDITGSADWRTVLIGGSRFGGRAIFALDVTDPDSISEATAAETVLWEFTHEDDPRMGYITEPPIIAKAPWGNNDMRWTAFFGNGYNPEEDATGFFMLDLEGGLDGTWTEGDDYEFVSFETGTDATGLSPVAVYDKDGDSIADRIYGGDLAGNLWVAKSGSKGFESAYTEGQGKNETALPLYEGATIDGDDQPITAAPLVIPNALSNEGGEPDLYVLFGTGQYLNNDDLGDKSLQSLYAVRDIGTSEVQRSDLAPRELQEDTDASDGAEVLFSEAVDETNLDSGWYVDLKVADQDPEGERLTLSPQVRGEYIFVNSTIPSDNPCVAGGQTRVMAFGLRGLTPERPLFEAYDGKVTAYRKVDGIASQSAFLGDYRFTPLSTGEVDVEETDIPDDDERLGRQGWQEMIE